MFRRLIIISGFLLFLLIAAAAWNIRQAGKPMSADEIPQWKLIQETQDSILLHFWSRILAFDSSNSLGML